MMTTQLRRGENGLLLWSLSDMSNAVHSFLGHNDVVLEFDWKRCRPGMKLLFFKVTLSQFLVKFGRW